MAERASGGAESSVGANRLHTCGANCTHALKALAARPGLGVANAPPPLRKRRTASIRLGPQRLVPKRSNSHPRRMHGSTLVPTSEPDAPACRSAEPPPPSVQFARGARAKSLGDALKQQDSIVHNRCILVKERWLVLRDGVASSGPRLGG
eukprot:3636630-Pleurochrysis_carterae.AAC.1